MRNSATCFWCVGKGRAKASEDGTWSPLDELGVQSPPTQEKNKLSHTHIKSWVIW